VEGNNRRLRSRGASSSAGTALFIGAIVLDVLNVVNSVQDAVARSAVTPDEGLALARQAQNGAIRLQAAPPVAIWRPTASKWFRRLGGVAMVRRRLPREHTDIEIHEIESSRRITATSVRVARECKKVTTPGGCIPRSTVVEITH
jgi:hypothetical protein